MACMSAVISRIHCCRSASVSAENLTASPSASALRDLSRRKNRGGRSCATYSISESEYTRSFTFVAGLVDSTSSAEL